MLHQSNASWKTRKTPDGEDDKEAMSQEDVSSQHKEERLSERPSRSLFALELSKLALVVMACSMLKVTAPFLHGEDIGSTVLLSCAASYLMCVGFLYLYAALIIYDFDGEHIRIRSRLDLPVMRINVDRVMFECRLSDIEQIDIISFGYDPVTIIFRKRGSGVSQGKAPDIRIFSGLPWFLSYLPFRLGFYGLKKNGALASRWREARDDP